MTEKEVKAIECRFVTHIPAKDSDSPDIHLIKELIHYTDGTTAPNIRFVKDFKRPFWITKKSLRNHQDKKEWEDLDRLDQYMSTQSDLRYNIARALGKGWSKETMRALSSSPYLYGSDITSTALIKHSYQVKYPNVVTGYTVCVYDIETDVVYGTNDIIIGTAILGNKIFTAVTQTFLQGINDPVRLIKEKYHKYLGEYIEQLNLQFEIVVVDNPAEIVKEVFKTVHAWSPDFVVAWNIDFDFPKSIQALENAGYKPEDIFSDPKVPAKYRRCEYKQGKKKKVTASGKVTPITPSSQWHTLYCTAGFYVLDAMCVYKRIRTPPAQEEPSYSLDAILKKELDIGKLKFTEADAYSGLRWHEFMQTKYKAEYVVYNIFDCLAVLELDRKTKDLSHTMPSFAGVTDFDRYTSNPRKIHDALHFYTLDEGKVISASGSSLKKMTDNGNPNEEEGDPDTSVSDDDDDEEDENAIGEKLKTLGLTGWIMTLPAHLTVDDGLTVIEEDPSLKTNIRGYVYDSDCRSAYPSATITCNVSKETTKRELSKVEGVDGQVFRMQNMNLVSGPVNAIEYCTMMMNFPKLDDLLAGFKKTQL